MIRSWLTLALFAALAGCRGPDPSGPATLRWYVFDEPSGAFTEAARSCSGATGNDYVIELVPLPTDADQQREQLVRRLAAGDEDIDLIGMDVIWTPEFAAAGWILPWKARDAAAIQGRLESTLRSATWEGRLWAAPFTTNTQLLWYRTDRVAEPPRTWEEMIVRARELGEVGTIQAQGARYEGLTVFFVSLLRSAGGRLLDETGHAVSLDEEPTRRVLTLMRELATSGAAPKGLANAREDQSRLGFESGDSSFMLNYTFVWPSARSNAPDVAERMGWARWPRVDPERPSRVTLGGINIGVGAYTRHPDRAFRAAICLTSQENQRRAARMGGLPPTIESLYEDAAVRDTFPFAEVLRETLRDAVLRPRTPLYNDVSLAISHTLHPMRGIDAERTGERLREAVGRALRSEGLL